MGKDLFADQVAMMDAFGDTTEGVNLVQTERYLHLIAEETCEIFCAANPDQAPEIKTLFKVLTTSFLKLAPNYDRPELFKEFNDVLVVTAGAGISAGYPMRKGWDSVWISNMNKVDPITGKVIRNSVGKVQKPAGWKKPDMAKLLTEF